MRILSARLLHARRNRLTGRVEAVVSLCARFDADLPDDMVRVAVSAPAATEPGAAPLRERLVAAAKLTYATSPRDIRAQRRAA